MDAMVDNGRDSAKLLAWTQKARRLRPVGDQPEKQPKTERLGFRADPKLAERVDDLIDAMQRSPRVKGIDVNTTVALKMLVRRALPLAELEYEGIIQGTTYEEEGAYLLSELRQLVSRLSGHRGVNPAELREVADRLHTEAEMHLEVDKESARARERRIRLVQQAREKRRS